MTILEGFRGMRPGLEVLVDVSHLKGQRPTQAASRPLEFPMGDGNGLDRKTGHTTAEHVQEGMAGWAHDYRILALVE